MNLDGRYFRVARTATLGVVSGETRLRLAQRGARVSGQYSGGSVERGCLIGWVAGDVLFFRYAQRERSGDIHGGVSVCQIRPQVTGRLVLEEHFAWDTRPGEGTNVFVESLAAS